MRYPQPIDDVLNSLSAVPATVGRPCEPKALAGVAAFFAAIDISAFEPVGIGRPSR